MIKNFVCIQCPKGCSLEVNTETGEVKGNTCPRGKTYGIAEATHPIRTITSTVKVEGGRSPRCSVKTANSVPKEKMFEVMDEIDAVVAKAPVHIGDVIIHDVCKTGVDVVATKDVELA
jgi:hypothetical protein